MTSIIIPAVTFIVFLFLAPPRATNTAVLDFKGRALRTNSMYYILPASPGRGGGLRMAPKNITSLCPLYVAQEHQEVYPGLPVWFLPVNPKEHQVLVSTDFNILFNAVNRCLQSAAWQLVLDKTTRRRYVVTGGDIGNPGNETLYSWFQIEKAGRGLYDYQIEFCPNVCPDCMVRCGHVGVFAEDGKVLLGVTGRPLVVMFKKA